MEKLDPTFVNERGVDCGVGVNIWLSSGCADCAIPGRYCANALVHEGVYVDTAPLIGSGPKS